MWKASDALPPFRSQSTSSSLFGLDQLEEVEKQVEALKKKASAVAQSRRSHRGENRSESGESEGDDSEERGEHESESLSENGMDNDSDNNDGDVPGGGGKGRANVGADHGGKASGKGGGDAVGGAAAGGGGDAVGGGVVGDAGEGPEGGANAGGANAGGGAAGLRLFLSAGVLDGCNEPAMPTGLTMEKHMQWHAKTLVRKYVLKLLRGPSWLEKAPRAVVDKALQLIDADGRRCWGQQDAYTRKRTSLDSFLIYDFVGCLDHIAKLQK